MGQRECRRIYGLGIALLGLLVGAPAVWGQCLRAEEQKLLANDAGKWDRLGIASSLYGDIAVVGAPSWQNSAGPEDGTAYVYRWFGDEWVEQQQLFADASAAFGSFGTSVSVDGETLVVGDSWDRDRGLYAGAAYVFRFNGEYWLREQKLLASDGVDSQSFGAGVAIDGDTVVVGAYRDDDKGLDAGAVYVYRFDGTVWVEKQKLTASDGAASDGFGWKVALDGEVMLVGSYYDDESGAAYIFRRQQGLWVEEKKLVSSDREAGDRLGNSLSLDHGVALLGAHGDDDRGNASGAAYVFRFDGSVWVEEAKLIASDAADVDLFGNAVTVEGDVAVIGSYRTDGLSSNAGSCYVFRFDGSTWNEQMKLAARDGLSGDYFGFSVALSRDLVLVGAPGDDARRKRDAGSAYIFQVPDLALQVGSESVRPGDLLSLDSCGGMPGTLAVLISTLVPDTPRLGMGQGFEGTVGAGRFDSFGGWRFERAVPPGLAGLALEFQTWGMVPAGHTVGSNPVVVSFR